MNIAELAAGETATPRGPISDEEKRKARLRRRYEVAGTPKPEPEGFWGKTVDIASRGTYASAAFVDTLLTDGWMAMGKALDRGAGEIITPEHRLYFSDVIKKHAPEFADKNPVTAGVLGFAGDVALDPFTWVTFGSVGGGRVAMKGVEKIPQLAKYAKKGYISLSRAGKKAVKGRAEFYRGEQMLTELGEKRVQGLAEGLIRKGYDPQEAHGMAYGVVRNAAYRRKNPMTDYSLAMSTPEIRNRAFRDVGRLIAADPTGQIGLVAKPGVRYMGKTIPFSEKLFKNTIWPRVLKYSGLAKLRESRPVSYINRLFNKYAGLPEEYIQAAKEHENALDSAERQIKKSVLKLFKDTTEEGRQAIGMAGHHLDDRVHLLRKQGWTDNYIRTDINREIKAMKLTDGERGLLVELLDDFKRVGHIEKEQGILNQLRGSYFPRFYELMKDGKTLRTTLRDRKILLPEFFTHSERRTFATMAVAKDYGFEPVADAMLLYTKRMMGHYRKLADDAFNVRVQKAFPELGQAIEKETAKRTANLHGLLAGFAKGMKRDDVAKMMKIWGEINGTKLTKKEAGRMLSTFGKLGAKKRSKEEVAERTAASLKKWQAAKKKAKEEGKAIPKKPKIEGYKEGRDVSALTRAWLRDIDNTDAAGVIELFAIEKGMADDLYKPLVKALEEGTHKKSAGQLTQDLIMDEKFIKVLPEANDIRYVADHIRFMGEGVYNKYTGDEINYVLSRYDRVLQLFKTSATVARPAFGVRQMFSNPFQAFLKGGVKAVDPRAAIDAAMAYSGKTRFHFSDAFGLKWTGQEYLDSALKRGIIRNTSLAGEVGQRPLNGARGIRRFAKEVNRKGLAMNQKNPAKRGFQKLWNGMFDYLHYPSVIEDLSRMTAYGNFLRQGFDENTAAKLVEEAMFDYSHGLSKFETRVVKRMIPFYSFQRFAFPLIAKATAKTPGRVANSVKSFGVLMEAYNKLDSMVTGGEDLGPLTPQERTVLPGWLLDQPHAFANWDAEMKAKFNTFNNFNPLDILGFMQFDDKGDFNLADTVNRLFLSQMTPFIKVPIETFWTKEDAFTGRSLEDARNIRDVDPSTFLVQMGTAIATSVLPWADAGSQGYAINKATNTQLVGQSLNAFKELMGAGGKINDVASAILKHTIGWEEGIDPYTGEPATYVGAYRMHWLGSMFPGLNDALRLSRQDKSVVEKSTNFLFGPTSVKLDLKQQKVYKALSDKRRIDEATFDVRDSYAREQHDRTKKSEFELQKILEEVQMDWAMLERGPVRGGTE